MPDDHDSRDGVHAESNSPDAGGLETSCRPETMLLASLVKLSDELSVAFDSVSGRDDVEYERARYIHALCAFSRFLGTNSAPTHYAQRLHRLAIELSDLNDGKTGWLLAQSSFGSVNAGKTTGEWIGRANAALGIAALVAAGSTRKQAATQAEQATGSNASKILSWYDEFRKSDEKSKTTNSLARARFTDLSELILLVDRLAVHKLADHFFKCAAEELQKQT